MRLQLCKGRGSILTSVWLLVRVLKMSRCGPQCEQARAPEAGCSSATSGRLRETATDGTPRSAKAAGAKLRELTQSFYSRLQDPHFYGYSMVCRTRILQMQWCRL